MTMKKTVMRFALATAALSVTGCYSTWDVPAKSLESLDGFREPEKRPIMDAEGDELSFDHSTELRFVQPGAEPIAAKFSAISVTGSAFSGMVRPYGQPMGIDLRQVLGVSAKKFSTVKTVIAIAIPVGAITIFSII